MNNEQDMELKSLNERAEFYKSLNIWVYPYKDYSDQFHWLDWRNLNDTEYATLSESFDWTSANGINVVAGKKGIMVLMFRKDNSTQYTTNSIKRILSILELQQDYKWLIEGDTSFSIVIDVCNMPMGKIQKKYKDFLIIYEDSFILPPGIEHYESYFRNGLPKSHPTQIHWNVLYNKLQEIDKLPIVFRGYTQEQKDYATKMKIVMGCILIIFVAIVTGIIAAVNSLSFGVWCGMFIVTLGAVAGLIYIMSH